MKSTHSARLERYLGTDKVNELSGLMRGWYGPPIALNGVPGQVYVSKDGDFVGDIRTGWEMSLMDHGWDVMKRVKRAARVASGMERNRLNAGFTSLSDMLSEATVGGKKQDLYFQKRGVTGVSPGSSTLWDRGPLPQAGFTASVAPGGRICSVTTAGSMNAFQNPAGGDETYLISSYSWSSVATATLLLYDRLFDVAKTMSSAATEAVTGVPTRYQGTTPGADDFAGGNFLFTEITSALGATAHNINVCTYTNELGASATMPSTAGLTSGIVGRLNMPTNQWFYTLAGGDVGIRTLTQMQLSASVTGGLNFVIGHPIAWMTHPVANILVHLDNVNGQYVLPRIFDSACLSFLEVNRGVATAATYVGHIVTIAG